MVPYRVDDGNHKILLEIGRDINYPFTTRGDYLSFEYVLKYNIDKESYRGLAGMTRVGFPLGDAYFVDQSEIEDAGFGLCEFTRTFASLPLTRVEGESVSFTLNVGTIIGPLSVVHGYAVTTTASVTYEYFLNTAPPVIRAPILYLGTLPEEIIVQDSEIGLYKGKIYYRKTYRANTVGLQLLPIVSTGP